MKEQILFCASVVMLYVAGCSPVNDQTQHATDAKLNTKADVESVLSLLYQQQAAEYRALCLQAYNIAKRRVDDVKKNKNYKGKRFAIITDLDETILDNSGSTAWLYLHDSATNYPFLMQWWLKGIADSVPGSVSFFNYAYDHGVDVYYISNRPDTDVVVKAAMRNMHNLGFPRTNDSDLSHFLFMKPKTKFSSKEARREQVEQMDSVIAFLGDNLIDLDSSFDGKPKDLRRMDVDKLKDKWGDRYIVFPNAIYGDWESRLYETPGLTIYQKDSVRAATLHAVE